LTPAVLRATGETLKVRVIPRLNVEDGRTVKGAVSINPAEALAAER